MDSYRSTSVDLKDDTHPPDCCCLVINRILRYLGCGMIFTLDNLSSSRTQSIPGVELRRPNIWRLSSSGVSEVLRPGVRPASDAGHNETQKHAKLC